MPEFFAQPDDFGEPLMSEQHASLGERLGAQMADTLDPKNSAAGMWLYRRAHEAFAGGAGVAVPGAAGEVDVYGGRSLDEQQRASESFAAAVPDTTIADARARVKQEGLDGHLTLPEQPSVKAPVLDLMIQEAHERRDREAAIARGPQGLFPDALGAVTSIGAGMIDPVNIAAFSIPVIGEARWGKILAGAGDSILKRAALNAGKGAAQGALGTAVLQPAEWWLHTRDGQDYTAADALRSIMMGAGMGGAMHAGFGALGDTSARFRRAPLPGSPEDLAMKALALPLPVHPAAAIADLPPAVREDTLRAAIADQIEGRPVRAGEMLEAAATIDPRIAESLALRNPQEPAHERSDTGAAEAAAGAAAQPGQAGAVPAAEPRAGEAGAGAGAIAAREAVFDDIHQKLISAGMSEDEAGYNAALISSRYATRAERLGGQAGTALDLYRAEGLDVRRGEFGAGEGRALAQRRRAEGPDLFAQRESEGQTSLPGTERIGEGEQAQGRADEALKPKVPQKPMDEGLFGDSAAQKSFFQSQPTAPTFYSALGRAVDVTKQDKASPEQWLGMLRNAASVKPEEMKWLGLEDWLKEQKGSVSKTEMQDFIRANQIDVKEVVKSGDVKYPGYRLPGGENYRELLLTLPQEQSETPHESSHWDEPNILAHVRFDDRVSDGKRTLHVAEVQSDWHQEGRRKGYQTERAQARLEELEAEAAALKTPEAEERAALARRMVESAVPEAPFKTTWPELAMKRMIRYAAEHGYDRVSWDTGATNAERYDLSKRISRITLEDNSSGGIGRPQMEGPFSGGMLLAYDHSGRRVINEYVSKPEELPDIVGKEAADKLLGVTPTEGRSAGIGVRQRKLEGEDIKVGGQGMTGFYDKILPAAVDRLVKKYGGKVRAATVQHEGPLGFGMKSKQALDGVPVHALDITPELRKSATEQGFSLFQSAPQKPRTRGIPRSADPPVTSYGNVNQMKAHPDYEAAKAGNAEAAGRLVADLVKPETIEAARTRFGKDALYVPVHAEESAGKNKIPLALAHYYAEGAGGAVDDAIVQASRAYHTGASAVERLVARPHFDGPVQPGKRYVIVDDVSVMGNTLAELAHHIQDGGGEVAGIVTLVNQSRMAHNVPKPHRTRTLEERLGQAIRDELGVEPGSLTAAETEYLLNFRDADSFRTRIAKARRERSERLLSKGVRPSEAEGKLEQGGTEPGTESPRGRITLSDNKAVIDLFKAADKSTFLHETGHLWLDELMRDAARADAPAQLHADRDTVLSWLGVKDASDIGVIEHEKWAEGFERYLADGHAPSNALAKAFEQFKQWLLDVYHAVVGLKQDVSPEITAVMDRLIATDKEIATRRADLADEAAAVTKNIGPKAPRGRAAADPNTWSLFEYLASKGGLKPDPELHAIFGGRRGPMVGGFGPLLRHAGMTLDDALRSAKDGHYLFDPADVTGAEGRLTPRDLLDLLDQENRKHKVYRNDHVVPDRGINAEEEAKHILSALHDELETSTGQKGIRIDPEIEDRVVEIIQKEGGTDVLAAYERAIMEDAEHYEGLADERRNQPETAAIPGWDHPDAGAASEHGAANPAERGQAGLSATGEGGANGAQPRSSGDSHRAPLRRALTPAEKADAFRGLADSTPDYNDPDAIAESRWADTLPEPASVDPARAPAAAQAAVREAEQIWRDLEPTLSEREREAFHEVLAQMDRDAASVAQIVKDGAACLAAAVM